MDKQLSPREVFALLKESFKPLLSAGEQSGGDTEQHHLLLIAFELFITLGNVYLKQYRFNKSVENELFDMLLRVEFVKYDIIHSNMKKEISLSGLELSKTNDEQIAQMLVMLGFAENVEAIYERPNPKTQQLANALADRVAKRAEMFGTGKENHSLEGLDLSKTNNLAVAQLLVELGFVDKLEDVYESV